jgi:RNA-binding protein YlmH
MVRIRLTRKLALSMNGVDVSRLQVGDVIELDAERAEMMIKCGWAEQVAAPLPVSN